MKTQPILYRCRDLFLEKYKNQSPNTQQNKKHIIDSFINSLQDKNTSEVTHSDIQTWEKQRKVTTWKC